MTVIVTSGPRTHKRSYSKREFEEFGTWTVSKTGNVLEGQKAEPSEVLEKLARLEGLEPPTLGSEDRCSIH